MKNFWLASLIGLTFFIVGYSLITVSRYSNTAFTRPQPEPTQQIDLVTPTSVVEPTIKPVVPLDDTANDPTETFVKDRVRGEIVNAIFSEQYDKLIEFMVFEPLVRIESSECCGLTRNVVAAEQLELISGGGTWSFIEADDRIQRLKSKRPDFYRDEDAIVGVSSFGYAVSFQLNRKNQIKTISLTTNYDLLVE